MSTAFKEGDWVLVLYLGESAKIVWLRMRDQTHAEAMVSRLRTAIDNKAFLEEVDAADRVHFVRVDKLLLFCTHRVPKQEPTPGERVAAALEKQAGEGDGWKG